MPPASVPSSAERLAERDVELERIDGLLADAAHGSGGALLVEGPAGIGKTRLLEAATAAASGNLEVAIARGGELESDFAYGIVRQLFEPLTARLAGPELTALFAGDASLATGPLEVGDEHGGPVRDAPGAVRHALYRMTLGLATARPLLIAVDDLQWADEPSLEWLLHVVRRLEGVRIAVIATRRTDDPCAGELIDRLADERLADRLEPAPLSAAATRELVHAALGEGAASRHASAFHELTGGNPFLLHELLVDASRELESGGEADLDPRALVPGGVARAVTRRLARLGAAATGLASAVAVLERAPTIDHAARLAGIDARSDVAAAFDALVGAGVLAGGVPLEFVHPLVREAVYGSVPPGRRAHLHGRAARLFAAHGAIEEAASHLMRSGRAPDAWGVDVLAAAADLADRRGAPGAAARYLRAALGSPDLNGRRTEIVRNLGLAELRTLDPRGFEHLREAIESASATDAARMALPAGRALIALWRHRDAFELMLPILGSVTDADQELARALEREVIASAYADVETLALGGERLALALARPDSSVELDPMPWGVHAMRIAAAGLTRADSVGLARRAIGAAAPHEGATSALPFPSIALVWADELDAAEAAWEAALARSEETGSALYAAVARGYLAICANARGEHRRAEALGHAALEIVLEAGVPVGPYPLAPLADALVARGEHGAALDVLGRLDPRTETSVSHPIAVFSRGRARVAAGDTERGLEDVLECGRRLRVQGAANPAIAPWRSVAAVWLVADDPERAADLAGEELRLARAFGARGAVGVALTGASAIAPTGRAVELATEAVHVLEPSPARGAMAAAVAQLGRALIDAGRPLDARQPLRRALDIAHRSGASALAERSRADLVRTGARPRRAAMVGPEALTPSEERVARLAAQGRSSREIADALVVSVRTVDMHLNRAYRKLEIGGRPELARALGR